MQLLMDLSLNLKGLVSQRLIPKIDGAGRIPAIEVMLNTPLMADLIFKGDVHEVKSLIAIRPCMIFTKSRESPSRMPCATPTRLMIYVCASSWKVIPRARPAPLMIIETLNLKSPVMSKPAV